MLATKASKNKMFTVGEKVQTYCYLPIQDWASFLVLLLFYVSEGPKEYKDTYCMYVDGSLAFVKPA